MCAILSLYCYVYYVEMLVDVFFRLFFFCFVFFFTKNWLGVKLLQGVCRLFCFVSFFFFFYKELDWELNYYRVPAVLFCFVSFFFFLFFFSCISPSFARVKKLSIAINVESNNAAGYM